AESKAVGLELVARRTRREWNEKKGIGFLCVNRGGRSQNQVAVGIQFRLPASRQQREYRLCDRNFQLLARAAPRALRRCILCKRMADVRHLDSGVLVERRLEREQRKQSICRTRDCENALAPPC